MSINIFLLYTGPHISLQEWKLYRGENMEKRAFLQVQYKANLRDLIAATSLVILLKLD